jgi:hypothetical protein
MIMDCNTFKKGQLEITGKYIRYTPHFSDQERGFWCVGYVPVEVMRETKVDSFNKCRGK